MAKRKSKLKAKAKLAKTYMNGNTRKSHDFQQVQQITTVSNQSFDLNNPKSQAVDPLQIENDIKARRRALRLSKEKTLTVTKIKQ